MRSNIIWRDAFNDREGNPLCIYDLAFSPDGNHIAVTAGSNIYIYSAKDGVIITSLKNHRDTVLAVAYSLDNRRFASGSSDKQVIIWSSKYEGILKYSHNESVRHLRFNPVSGQLASCTNSDFGIWSPEQKSVIKHKISSPINCCSWSSDGHYLALGTNAGFISIRSMTGEEKSRIEKQGGTPSAIWALSFCPVKQGDQEILASADWSQTLYFFDVSGKLVGKERRIGFDSLSLEYFANGEFLIIAGTNHDAILFTKEGILIGSVFKSAHWIWSVKPSPSNNHVAIACQNGNIVLCELNFSTVHSLYKDRYVYRENMSDVIVQHLLTEEKVRVKCREVVKKIAVYKNRLAIQLPDRLIIYELSEDSNYDDMRYKVKEKINQKFECTSFVVGSESLVLCQDRKLQNISFRGSLEREWTMEHPIRYLKIIGGHPNKESILVGLKNGQVLQIFIDNPFPISLIKTPYSIRCLDLSMYRKKLATVDEKGNLYVHDLVTKDLLYQERNANSVAWNSKFEDMLCYSGMGNLSIKASDFPAHHQQLQGFVVGFSGAKVFCLHFNTMSVVEVSQSVPLYHYIERKQYLEAYQTACLKVTEYDWLQLAHGALESLELIVAKKAFIKTRNYLYLDLIHNYLSASVTSSKTSELLLLGDVMAYKGRFTEATKFYKQAGREDRAIAMYTDLRMFDQVQNLIRSGDEQLKKKFVAEQANLVNNIDEPRAAAEMYLSAGETSKAIEIMGQNGWIDMLSKTAQSLDKGDTKNLALCANYLSKLDQNFLAAEILKKIGDWKNLALVYIKSCQWDEALRLAEQFPELKESVYFPYANWLAENNRFIEAQKAFHKAGKISDALKVLNQLISNAINEHRFDDASYYCWILSNQCLELIHVVGEADRERLIAKFEHFQKRADIYYAYHNIYRYIEEPFTSFFPDALFNMARFLCHATKDEEIAGVSKVLIFYAFAKQGQNLGAYKLSRTIHDILHSYKIPSRFQEHIEMADLTIRAKPFNDSEDLLPLCYRCSTTNPLYNSEGNQCKNCKQPFIISFTHFDILPLVEFRLGDDLTEEEAIKMIQTEKRLQIMDSQKSCSRWNGWREERLTDTEVLKLDDSSINDLYESVDYQEKVIAEDPFTERMASYQDLDLEYQPILITSDLLEKMKASDVIIAQWPHPLPTRFYRNLMTDMSVTKCDSCLRFFHTDELESQSFQLGHCPFCRTKRDASC